MWRDDRSPLPLSSDSIVKSGTSGSTCCVVGGGPAGAVLALLLARGGVSVTLLERHGDFDRDFRGDTLHPSVLEIMEQLGLAEALLRLPHAKIRTGTLNTPEGPVTIADFGRLKTRYPFITMLPQVEFLEFVTREASRYPGFQLRMGARVEELIEEDGRIRGVRYRSTEGAVELRTDLVVGADGRFSTLRKLAGFEPVRASPPVDVLWFRLPRRDGDTQEAGTAYLRSGSAGILLDRGGEWQVALVIPKGSFQELRGQGIDALRGRVARTIPPFAGRVAHLQDWTQVSLLSIAADRLRTWYRPGLLLIGDAAHVMSPVGGLGINYAIQDAVEAANVLAAPLREGRLEPHHLAEVQRRREWPTRIIQAFQAAALDRIVAPALAEDRPFKLPLGLRLLPRIPLLRTLPARLIAFGFRTARVETGASAEPPS